MSLLVDVSKDYGKFQLNVHFEHNQGILGMLGASGSGKSLTLKLISGILTPDRGKIILDNRVLYDSERKINLRILGMLGASGSGKSLTLKLISGILTPDRGKIILDNRVLYDSERKINLLPKKRKVGYLFQNYALFPNMTVEKNILCGLHWEKDKRRKREKLQSLVELLRIEELLKKYPAQLSGGQQQRTALARILVSEPELLPAAENSPCENSGQRAGAFIAG